MTTINTISIESVREAYTKIGLKPVKCITISNDLDSCCPLAALYLAENDNISQLKCPDGVDSFTKGGYLYILRDNIMLWAERTFGGSYRAGIVCGFDDRGNLCGNNPEVDMEAYKLGQQLRHELLDYI